MLRKILAVLALLTATRCLEGAGTGHPRPLTTCGPPPPMALIAPSPVGAGSPNRVVTIGPFAGVTYDWSISNGTITSGLGTNQITFTAGTAGIPLDVQVAMTLSDGCPWGGGFAVVTVLPVGQAVQFYTTTPCRLVDTRAADAPALDASGGPDRAFLLTGACGIPPEATSLSVNVTVVSGPGAGALSIYRGDGAPSGTSTISFAAGQTRANNAVVQLATDGSGTVKVNNSAPGPVQLILDVNGYFE
jgi:PKD-like domain